MLLPSRLWGLALFAAVATLSSSPHHHADATHAPVWDPEMAAAPVDSAVTDEKGQPGFTLKLYNVRDAMYYSKIRVGSPPQEVRVAFDTAASDLAVLGIKSEGHMSFDHSKSSTYQADGRPVKLRDTSTGILARDSVLLHEGLPVDAQFFTEINNVTMFGPYYKDLRLDGWLGLAPRATQSVGEVPTILHSLFTKHVVEKPFVGISMPKGENGYISFGQFSGELNDNEMKYIEQPHPGLWTHPMDKIDVGGKPIALPSATFVVLDTVEPFIAGPPRMVEAIAKAVGAKKHPDIDLWMISCVAPMHNITFWSGEDPLTVTVNEMVSIRVSETDCVFMMRSWYDNEKPLADWSFGLPVFHAYFFGFGYDEPRRLGYMPHPK